MTNQKELQMKHFVLGFVFDISREQVLLVCKTKPKWQAGCWNGIGGKIEKGEIPLEAMNREAAEETKCRYDFEHSINFVCPGGTVFVFKATIGTSGRIPFQQVEREVLDIWPVNSLPMKIMNNLKWLIPLCLSTIQMPIILQQNTLGVNG